MKKIALTLLTIFSLFVISCEIGLGASVDTDAPSLEILNPPVDSVIRDTFALSGTWADDGNIASVNVALKRTDISGETKNIAGTLAGDIRLGGSGTWTAEIVPVAEDGTKLISDGSYQATVTIKDTVGRTTIRNTTFTIDNTPPVIVLTRPSTAADSLSSDTYGQTFNLEGQAADTNNVSLIEVMIYSDAECTNHIHTVPLKNVPNSINMDVAKFVKGDTENDYFKIYGESTTEGGPKQFYCKVVAYDGAQRFPADGSAQTEADQKGNGIDTYYLYKDIATTILQNYKITEVYSMLNGTYTASGTARSVSVEDVMTLLNKSKKAQGKFTLNPKNNPTFAVTGRNPLLLNGSDFTGSANNISDGTKVVIEVSPGLDGILLEESSLKVFAVECDLNGKKTGTPIALDFDKEESGTSYRLITKIDKAKGLVIGRNYLFDVQGWDQSESKNNVEPVGLAYGFHMATSGKAPVLELTTPPSSTSYTNESKQVFVGSVSVEDGVPKVIATYNNTEYEITNFTTSANGNETKYSFEWESPDFGDSNGTHQFEFKAVMDTDSQPIERTIVHDIDKPVIGDLKINEAKKYYRDSSNAHYEDGQTYPERYLNATVNASIDITDPYDAIKTATYKIILNDNEAAATEVAMVNPSKFVFPPLDTTQITDGTKVTIKVVASDRAGNTETHSEEFIVDQETNIPFVYPKDHESLSLKEDAQLSKIAVTASSSFVLKVYDDDGVSSGKLAITAQISNKVNPRTADATEWTTLASPTITLVDDDITIRVPESGGFYKYKITVKDIANDKTYEVPEFVINAAMAQATITSITKTPDYIQNITGKSFTITIDGISSQGPYTLFRKIEGVDSDFVPVNDNLNDFPITDIITLASNNSISEGTKVYYYVLDGTPRPSNKEKFVSLTFDDDAPTLTITSPSTNKTGTSALSEPIMFGGSSSDAKSGIAKVYYRFTQDPDASKDSVPYVLIDSSTQPLKSSPFTIDNVQFIEGTDPEAGKLQEGKWYFQAYAEDAAGNISATDVKEFDINLSAPELTVTVNGDTDNCKLSGGAYYFKGNFTGSVTSLDTSGSGTVEFFIGNANTPVLSWDTINNTNKTFEIPASNFNESVQQKITIKATDSFGNYKTEIINVYKDTTIPDLAVTNPGDQSAASVTIRGTANDAGVGVEKVQWSTSSTGTYADVTIFDHNSPNWSLSVPDLGSEGTKEYYFKAVDALNNTTAAESVSFMYDMAAPSITTKSGSETLTSSTTKPVTTTNDKFKFTIVESNGLATSNAVSITVKKGEETLTFETDYSIKDGTTSVSALTDIQPNKEYTIEINSYTDALYTYEISATDIAGKTSGLVTRSIRLDTKAPVIDVTSPDFKDYQNSASINVKGTCEDDSGTLYVWYATGATAPAIPTGDLTLESTWTTPNTWKKAEGTSSWTAKNITGEEGTTTKIYFVAVDKNGIATSSSEIVEKEYKVDLYNPAFEETSIDEGKAYKNASYTFSGKASDTGSGIKSIVISAGSNTYAWYKNTSDGTTTSGFTYNSSTNNWSYTVSVASAAEQEYNYTLTATDGADKTTILSRTVVYDKTKPVIATIPAGSWYKTRTITITPTVTENGSGVDTVEATIDASTASSRTWIDIPLSNGAYKGTVDFAEDGKDKKIYIRAKDRAGNISLEREVSVNIDTTDPDLEKLKYNVGSTSLKDIGGTVYINATNGITVYGSYFDDNSGVDTLVFEGTKKDSNNEFIQPTITYSTESLDENDEDKDEVNELSYSDYTSTNAASIKYWKAVFANNILETARLSVTGKNIAGGSKTVSLFMVNKDETTPTFTRPKIEPDTEDRTVYQDPASNIYYLNNELQKFTISGLAEDNTAVDKVYVKIENVNASGDVISTSRVIEDNNASGYFNNIEFKQANGTVWTGGAKVTITTTDIAGNSTADDHSETVLNIVFDTQGPNGVHVMDKSTAKNESGETVAAPKDLYFRIGDQSRDDYVVKDAIEEVILDDDGNGTAVSNGTAQDGTVTSGVPEWAEKDKDVGGKYSGNTYGNAETVKLRGKFEDKVSDEENAAEGSGVNLIYYKVFTTQPNDSNKYASSFLKNYKTQADGYFSLLKTPETRRVFYTDDSTGTNEGKLGGTFTPVNGGTVAITKGTDTKKKYYTDITTNYKTTIANLSAGENYLVLVAVDNVGNAALEGVEYNGKFYSDYRINVDYESPTISSDAPAIGEFTNASAPLTLTGSVADNPSSNNAGIKSVWLKYDETKAHWIKAVVDETAGTWTATVSVATLESLYGTSTTPVSKLFTATATDKSGKGNSFSCNLTVTIDKTPPTVEVSVTEKSNAGTNDDDIAYVNGSIKIKGTASDTNGLKEGETIKLYYITDASEKNGVTAISKWTPYTTTTIDSNNEWTLNTAAAPFVDGTTYYFTVAATDKAGNTGYAAPLALAVNKDSDRPTVKFYMNFGDDVDAISLDKVELDGVISDDDGTPHADKVWYYISYDTKNASGETVSGDNEPEDNAWILYNSSNTAIFKYNATTGSFTFKPIDGTAYIWLKIQDNGGGEFISSKSTTYNFNTPVITDQNGDKVLGRKPATDEETVDAPRLKFKKDTVAPSTDSFAYLAKNADSSKEAQDNDGNGWSTSTGSALFGGTTANTFKVRIYAYDANGIPTGGVKFRIPKETSDVTEKVAVPDSEDATKYYYEYTLTKQAAAKSKTINGNTYDLYWSDDIDVTGFVTGQRSCIMDTYDDTKHKTETISFNIDNTPPVATFTSHTAGDQIRASFNLKGSFENGDAGTTLKYILSTSPTAPGKTSTDWNSRDNVKDVSSMLWQINFDGKENTSSQQNTHDGLPKQVVANLLSDVEIASTGTNEGKAVYKTAGTGHSAGDLYRDITTVYFHVLATDAIGNSQVSTFNLKLDPQGDIPTIKMDYPAYDSDSVVTTETDTTMAGLKYAKLSGNIRAQGSAEDDKNIVGIYMQIDPGFNMKTGKFDSNWETKECPGKIEEDEDAGIEAKTTLSDFGYTIEDMYTSYNEHKGLSSGQPGYKSGTKRGIRVGSSSSWNITLNSSSEFNSDSGAYIAIKFYAVDEDGNISIWDNDDLMIIYIDSDAPKIGSSVPLYLYQYGFKEKSTGTIYYAKGTSDSDVTPKDNKLYTDADCKTEATAKTYSSANFDRVVLSSMEYKKNMWLKGEWWLSGSIEDESGIYDIKMKGTSIKSNCGSEQTWNAGQPEETKGYIFNYKVGSTETVNGYGTLTYALWAEDEQAEGSRKPANLEITVQYDNKAPTLASENDEDYLIPTDVMNEQGFYKVQSAVTERDGESGFDKVFFYFKRDTTVYDAYMPKNVTGNALTGLVEDSNIYWKTNTVTAVSANVITVSADVNIHRGGLVKVGGTIYTITGVSGTSVTLSGNPPALSENETIPAYFAIGHVVDHVGTEGQSGTKEKDSTAYGFGYYKENSEDDGDLMLEKVYTGTTKTLWYGLINSRNIPDGAIEINYVAFDKAGNMAHRKITNAFVKNNAPRLASLRVWTDYNGNTHEDNGESDTKYYSKKDRKIGGTTVSRSNAVTDNFIVTGNDLGIEAGASAFMRVTDTTKFYPEIVGGNGALYYSYKIGAGTTPEGGSYTVNWSTTGNGPGAFAAANRTGYVEYSDISADYMKEDENNESYVEGSSDDAIEVSGENILSPIGNGLKWFEYTIWDSTPGGTKYVDTLTAKFTVLLNVAYSDNTPPNAVISPFYWNSKDDNSIAWNGTGSDKKALGHIELENDLNDTIKNTKVGNTKMGDDPKVSGQIVFEGTASDEIRLSKLYAKFTDHKGLGSDNYTLIGTYEPTNGTWTPASGDGWSSAVTNTYFGKDGHRAKWTVTVDTAQVGTGKAVAALDREFTVYAVDERGNGLGTGLGNSSQSDITGAAQTAVTSTTWSTVKETEDAKEKYYTDYTLRNLVTDETADDATVYTSNKTPYYKVDVVPYITEIKTNERTASGLKENNIRAASGKYSILSNKETNIITISGFNFGTLVAKIATVNPNSDTSTAYGSTLVSTTQNTATETASVVNLSITKVTTKEATIDNDDKISKSGYLELFSEGIRALNNINNNDAYGTANNTNGVKLTSTNASVSDYEKAYNREPDYYTTKNVQLTDDRYLRFFDMKDTGIKNGYYPVMIMNGNNPVFGYVDKNGVNTKYDRYLGTNGNPGFPENYMPQRAEFSATTGKTSSITYLIGGMDWDQMAMAKDESGKFIHATMFNDSKSYLHVIYNNYAENQTWSYYGTTYTDGWGDETSWNIYSGDFARNPNNNAITLEANSFGGTTLIGRYQGIKLAARGNSTTTNGAIYYMAYYDDNTTNSNIIFRTFKVRNGNNNHLENRLSGNYSSNLSEKNTNGRVSAASNATKYLDLGVTSDGYAVIVYYDKDGKLRLVHSDAAVTGAITGTTFSATDVNFTSYIGQYVSMAIDSSNHIHIAAFDANKSTLRYIYLDSYTDKTPDEYTVDASTSVGKWTQIKIHPTSGKPYIAYYNNAEDGQKESIRLAYLSKASIANGYDSNGYATGDWEYMTVPSLSPAQGGDNKFQAVCLDFDSSGRPVVGYLGTNLEFGKWLSE